jgi:hypothetical protein
MNIDTVNANPLDIGEVLGDTFAVIGRNFVLLANVAVMFVAIPAVIRIAGVVLAPLSPTMFSILSAVGLAASVVGALLAWAAIYQIAMEGLHGQTPSPSSILDKAAQKFWPMLVLTMLMGIGVFFGTVLLIVPGVILSLAWSVALPAMVLEDRGVFAAFRRSLVLTRGKRWPIFLLNFMITLVTVVANLLLFAAFGGFRGLMTGQTGLVGTVLSGLMVVIWVPFVAVMTAALFNRLRGEESRVQEVLTGVFA